MENSTTTKTIIIIDDDDDDYLIFKTVLKKYYPNYKIIHHRESTTVVNTLKQLETLPACILLDLHMPISDGFEILAELRGQTRYRGVPIVMLSGSSNPHNTQQAQELGITFYLEKPNSISEAHELVSNYFTTWLHA